MKDWHIVLVGAGAYIAAQLFRSALNGWILTPYASLTL